MRRMLFLTVVLLLAAACGGGATATDATPAASPAAGDLAGLSFDVHQEPG